MAGDGDGFYMILILKRIQGKNLGSCKREMLELPGDRQIARCLKEAPVMLVFFSRDHIIPCHHIYPYVPSCSCLLQG